MNKEEEIINCIKKSLGILAENEHAFLALTSRIENPISVVSKDTIAQGDPGFDAKFSSTDSNSNTRDARVTTPRLIGISDLAITLC